MIDKEGGFPLEWMKDIFAKKEVDCMAEEKDFLDDGDATVIEFTDEDGTKFYYEEEYVEPTDEEFARVQKAYDALVDASED